MGVQQRLNRSAVKARGYTDSQMVRAEFPQPHYFGPRSPRWLISQLDEFDAKVAAGEIVLFTRDEAVAQTAPARAAYMARVASGEVRASRQATAAKKRSGVPA